ncbi:hypothetical protein J6590_050901 [Homalodisca vitripennis]|nr:hypothetical protein J6590_050901 [Homalodisca vitripennis]
MAGLCPSSRYHGNVNLGIQHLLIRPTHQLNGRRDSAITLSTRPLDFDLCLRMGRGLQ